MATDPYAAPKARVADVQESAEVRFNPEGQAVAAGNGWRWIADAWGLFTRQPGMWILLLIVAFVLFFLLGLVPFLGFIATSLLWPVIAGGFILGCRDLDRGSELRVGHIVAGFSANAGTLILVGVFNVVATIAVFVVAALIAGVSVGGMLGATLGGSDGPDFGAGVAAIVLWMLISLAALVPIWMAIWFAPTLIVLHDLGTGAALRASFRGCLKNVLPFLVYGVAGFGFSILATIPLGLGWLAFGPVLVASVYTAYRDIYTEA